VDRDEALAVLAELHAAQRAFYAGESAERLRDLLTPDIRWTIPGDNAIAGVYEGIDAVMEYFARRRDLASRTFRMFPGEVLVGDGDHAAVLTDGVATIGGAEHRWSTVGLYRFRDRRIASCWLLPLDAAQFDRVWRERSP
jgi:ketosteroid isomerase-like protein